MQPDLAALNTLRIRRDWSWRELAAQMARARVGVAPRTLHHLLTTPTVVPHDRTLYKIQKFLQILRRQRSQRAAVSREATL